MGTDPAIDPETLCAHLHDVRGVGWPGELELYRALAAAEGSTVPTAEACSTSPVAPAGSPSTWPRVAIG